VVAMMGAIFFVVALLKFTRFMNLRMANDKRQERSSRVVE